MDVFKWTVFSPKTERVTGDRQRWRISSKNCWQPSSTKCLTTKTRLSWTTAMPTAYHDCLIGSDSQPECWRYFKQYQKLEKLSCPADLIRRNQSHYSLSGSVRNRPQPSWTGRNRWNPLVQTGFIHRRQQEKIKHKTRTISSNDINHHLCRTKQSSKWELTFKMTQGGTLVPC